MSDAPERFDLVVIGSGPAGHSAAMHAGRRGLRVLLVERDRGPGGACVQRGTIPSKTLRETAAYFAGLRLRASSALSVEIPPHLQLRGLMGRMESVVSAHTEQMSAQLERAGVEQWHGRASFVSPTEISVMGIRGKARRVIGERVLLATGSRPRTPPNVPVDHEHILDSDSLLSTMYLPESLAILGGGVIASEYASIFACLGVKVTMIDRGPRPIGFLEPELSERFVEFFEGHDGCRFLGGRTFQSVEWDGVSKVVTVLDDGDVVEADKLFCALGRVANVEDLQLDLAGLAPTDRGLVAVDENGCTDVPHIYAAGDVIGPPSLASCSKHQGIGAVCHAFGMAVPTCHGPTPIGIYTIPEISSVGLTEGEARDRFDEVVIGRANFQDVPRAMIAGNTAGFLKLIARTDGTLLGAHVFGEGATEVVHIAQIAMAGRQTVETLAETIFNFPTLAESYVVAAQDAVRQIAETKRVTAI